MCCARSSVHRVSSRVLKRSEVLRDRQLPSVDIGYGVTLGSLDTDLTTRDRVSLRTEHSAMPQQPRAQWVVRMRRWLCAESAGVAQRADANAPAAQRHIDDIARPGECARVEAPPQRLHVSPSVPARARRRVSSNAISVAMPNRRRAHIDRAQRLPVHHVDGLAHKRHGRTEARIRFSAATQLHFRQRACA